MYFSRNFFSFSLPILTILIIFLGFQGVFAPIASAQSGSTATPFVFLRDLREGDSGADVRELQKLLNIDPATRVSVTGNGSPGNETSYFGKSTKSAVIRFQNKYREEILRPAGQIAGTGFIGLWTRLTLNQILLNASVAQTPVRVAVEESSSSTLPNINLSGFAEVSHELRISSLSRYSGIVGSSVTIGGSGFSQTSTVSLGNKKIENLSDQNSDHITFKIPEIQTGRYDVSVSVGGKVSNKMPFMVTTSGAVLPTIEKIEPATVTFGEQITITGKNFTSTGNIISSSLGVIKNLASSDGKTITFTISRPTYVGSSATSDTESISWPINLTVVNTNGISKNTSASQIIMKVR